MPEVDIVVMNDHMGRYAPGLSQHLPQHLLLHDAEIERRGKHKSLATGTGWEGGPTERNQLHYGVEAQDGRALGSHFFNLSRSRRPAGMLNRFRAQG